MAEGEFLMARMAEFPARKRGGHFYYGAGERRRQGRSAGIPDPFGRTPVSQIALRRLK
jgi:hypothetical protein